MRENLKLAIRNMNYKNHSDFWYWLEATKKIFKLKKQETEILVKKFNKCRRLIPRNT